MIGFSLIFLLMVGIIGILVAAYYFVYSKSINRKIINGESGKTKMIDMPRIIMMAVMILLILYSIMISYDLEMKTQEINNQTEDRDNFVEINLADYTYCGNIWENFDNEDASYAKMYSKDENAGYSKIVQNDGNFSFTVFIRDSEADDFHPDFLCFVDYTGQAEGTLYRYEKTSFLNEGYDKAQGCGGGDQMDSLLYIGNLNEGASFRITIGYLNETEEKELSDAEDQALESKDTDMPEFTEFSNDQGSVVITMD